MKKSKQILWVAFAVWCFWLLWMLIVRRLDTPSPLSLTEYAREHLSLVPLSTVSKQAVQAVRGDLHAITNLGGNTLLFVPVGWALPALMPALRRFWRCILVFAAAIAAVELAQLLLRVGVCETDDLLLNCMGASVGFWVWKRWFGKADETC